MNAGHMAAALLVGLAVVAWDHGSASAQPEPGDGARAARLITLAVATDSDEEVAQIVSHLRPLLEMRGLRLAVRRVDSLDLSQRDRSGSQVGVRARVWLDLTTADEVHLLFSAGDRPPTTGRVVPTSGRIDQVAAAEISEIILAALTAPEGALSAGGRPEGASSDAEAAASSGGRPGLWRRSLGILGGAQTWAREAPAVPEVGLSVLFEWRPAAAAWSGGLWSSLRYRPPFQPDRSDPVDVRVRGGEAEVLAVLARRIGARARVGLGAGLGVDARLAEASPPAGASLVDQQPVRELAVFVRSALRLDLLLAGPFDLFAALTLDVFPLQDRLLVRQSGEPRAVFTPWPLRPGALLGVSLAF